MSSIVFAGKRTVIAAGGYPHARLDCAGNSSAASTGIVEQLEVGGLMAIPVGTFTQELRIMKRTASGMDTLKTLPVRFVPMTGKGKKN